MGQQRPGQHGVTNFAVESGEASQGADGMHDRALKFFTDLEAFERVQKLHNEPAAAYCMVVVKEFFPGDPQNVQLGHAQLRPAPPCIVTMRLETFEEKAARGDLNTMQIITYLAGVQ